MINKKTTNEKCYCCEVCGEEHGLDDLNDYKIKGRIHKICKQCATAIKGII